METLSKFFKELKCFGSFWFCIDHKCSVHNEFMINMNQVSKPKDKIRLKRASKHYMKLNMDNIYIRLNFFVVPGYSGLHFFTQDFLCSGSLDRNINLFCLLSQNSLYTFLLLKGIFNDSSSTLLWHKSADIFF